MAKTPAEIITVAGQEVALTNGDKVFFPKAGYTKRDLVHYYLAVAEGALRGAGNRPMALKRFVHGAEGEFFFQKRAPETRPDWIETCELKFPSGRSAHEVVLNNAAQLSWVINLGCIDLNPHPVRANDVEHPDELRVDFDPVPGVPFSQVREVALVTREALAAVGLVGWPKTSGSRGIHLNVRIHPRWTFAQVRRAALALARDVEQRAPSIATSKWWKEERHGVFLDYNQNAKDRTVASAYSVRPTPDARVSMPLAWDDVAAVEPGDFTLKTVPAIFAARGDLQRGIDESPGDLEALLELSARHEREGLGDAPWPPHYAKGEGEPMRVAPSRAKKPKAEKTTGEGEPEGASEAKPKKPRRKSTQPLVEIARAAKQDEALAGLERWKARHPQAAAKLQPADVLVDNMRGRFTTWTRIRVNLKNVPEAERPSQEPLDPDYDPWQGHQPPPKPRPHQATTDTPKEDEPA